METMFKAVDLTKLFPLKKKGAFKKRQFVHAVDSINFEVKTGETFGIVGESGCGKTTLGRLMLRLIEPTSGRIFFKDRDINSLSRGEMKKFRNRVQIIFQDPFSSLDPVKNILNIVTEPLRVHRISKKASILKETARETLEAVELPTSENFMLKRPSELSGGERQRVGIARAIILRPEFIVADEPVSMLDASVKAEIISLMTKLKQKAGLTYVFITHEMSVAYNICDRIAVMYAGKMVELGSAEQVIRAPLHPYTRLLIQAVPPLHPDDKWGNKMAEGEVPYFTELPGGCRFHPRCPQVQSICKMEEPNLKEVASGHYVACHKM